MTREQQLTKVTLVGSIGNLVLLTFKFVAGILAGSSAMVADAVHSLSDFLTDIIVLVFVRIGNRIAIEVHVRLDGSMSLAAAHDIVTAIEHRLRDRFGQATHITIHMEPRK